jgi:hypothetical protein
MRKRLRDKFVGGTGKQLRPFSSSLCAFLDKVIGEHASFSVNEKDDEWITILQRFLAVIRENIQMPVLPYHNLLDHPQLILKLRVSQLVLTVIMCLSAMIKSSLVKELFGDLKVIEEILCRSQYS